MEQLYQNNVSSLQPKEQQAQITAKPFEVDQRVINCYEREQGIQFDICNLKELIDDWIDNTLEEEGQYKWVQQQSNNDLKVWYRWVGTEHKKELPLARAEFYFPEIEDPRILKAALC